MHKETKINVPSWVQDSVFYQIFPDRFYKSNNHKAHGVFKDWGSKPTYCGFHGGNIWGIIDKLDYLEDLGINAIYLNPIFSSACNHRYHTHDYYQVDPILGGNKAFKCLLDEAHRIGFSSMATH
jgi:neopullulanase